MRSLRLAVDPGKPLGAGLQAMNLHLAIVARADPTSRGDRCNFDLVSAADECKSEVTNVTFLTACHGGIELADQQDAHAGMMIPR